MVAGIFAAHGVFWGNRQQQSAGYDTFENQEVKGALKRHYGLPFCEHVAANGPFLEELFSLVPNNKPWIMKTGIEYFYAFAPMKPFNVFITRNAEAVVKSICEKRPDADPEKAREAVKWRYTQMKILHQQYGGVWIDTDQIIAGDLTQVREALEYCGIVYDEQAVIGAIKK